MAGKSFPWNSEVGNERYFDATDFSTVFSAMYSNGVFYMEGEGNLEVVTNSGMTIKVKPGISNLNGIFYYDKSDKILTITPVSSSSQSRIDNVVVKYNEDEKEAEILVKEGTNATTPTPPLKEPDEFVLAQIKVRGAATSIISSDITDTRGDSNICGFVTSTRPELPNNIVEALEAAMDNKMDKSGGVFTSDVDFSDGTTAGVRFVFAAIPRLSATQIPNISDPRDLTPKSYVDNLVKKRTSGTFVSVPVTATNTVSSYTVEHSIGSLNYAVALAITSVDPRNILVSISNFTAESFQINVVRTASATTTNIHYVLLDRSV